MTPTPSRLRFLLCVVFVAALVCAAQLTAQEGRKGYYRQPTLWGDTVVFVAEGDKVAVGDPLVAIG